MVDYNSIADRIFDQLKGFGYSVVVFDKGGRQTADAEKGRSFYSKDQKFTVELDEEENLIKFKYGSSTDLEKIKKSAPDTKVGCPEQQPQPQQRAPAVVIRSEGAGIGGHEFIDLTHEDDSDRGRKRPLR